MRVFILVLILLAFIQSTLIPLDLVGMFILIRAFLVDDSDNLWLAFGLGLLVSLLMSQTLGLISIAYIIGVVLVHLLKRSQITSHWLVVIPTALILYLVVGGIIALTEHQSLDWWKIVAQVVLTPFVYLGIKIWEERFIVPTASRLKLRG